MRRLRQFLPVLFLLALCATALPSAAFAESLRVTATSFTDGTHGYAVGGRVDAGGGFASYTDDGGATWRHTAMSQWVMGVGAQSPPAASLIGFFERAAYSTSNSGVTWTRTGEMVPGVGTLEMADIERLPDGRLVSVGAHKGTQGGDLATIWMSTNGGVSWTNRFDGPLQPAPIDENGEVGEAPSTIARLESIDFTADGQVGWAVGSEWYIPGSTPGNPDPPPTPPVFKQALVYKTTDYGSTWTTQTVGAGSLVTGVSVVDSFTAWLTSVSGQVYKTNNGLTWNPMASSGVPGNRSRASIAALDANTAIVAGDSGRGIKRTTDGGLTWTLVASPTENMYTLAAADAYTVYAGGTNTFLRSTDSGATWTSRPLSTSTSLTMTSSGPLVNPGQSATLTGVLRTAAGTPLSGKTVQLQYSDNGTTWNANGTAVTVADGTFAFSVTPITKTYYRAVFAGEFGLDASATLAVTVAINAPPTTSVTGVPAGWSLNDVTLVFSASDSDSGIAPTTYHKIAGTTLSGSSRIVADEGETVVEYWSVDNLGLEESHKFAPAVKIDKYPPSVPGQPSAQVSGTSVTLSWSGSTDSGSGLKGYNVYDGATKVASLVAGTSKTLTAVSVGSHSYSISAVDNSNKESAKSAPQTASVTSGGGGGGGGGGGEVDTTPPATTITGVPPSWTNTNVTVTLTSSEAGQTFYRLGSAAQAAYSGPVPIQSEGETPIEFWSVDTAGNPEPHQVVTIRIDKGSPSVSTDGKASYEGTAVVNISATDSRSGVRTIEYKLDGGAWTVGTRVTTTGMGVHALSYRATDFAGNPSTGSLSFTVTAPPDARPGTRLAPLKSVYTAPYGRPAAIEVKLTDSFGSPLTGRRVNLKRSDGATYTMSATTAPGTYRASVYPYRYARTAFVASFAGDAGLKPASATVSLLPQARLGVLAPTTAVRYRSFKVSGSIAPIHSARTTVVLRFERLEGRTWRQRSTKSVYVSAGRSSFASLAALPAAKWRVRVSHADASHATTYSTYRYITVK